MRHWRFLCLFLALRLPGWMRTGRRGGLNPHLAYARRYRIKCPRPDCSYSLR